MNRRAIKTALAAYKEAKKQQAAILKDKTVQTLFAQEKEAEARELISIKYPNGDFRKVNQLALTLIGEMVKGIPAWKGINPMDAYTDHKIFDEFLALAAKV